MPVLKALGESNRLRIVRVLLKAESDVTQIAEELGLSEYNVSKHLRVLKESGLIQMEKRGRRHIYCVARSLRRTLKVPGHVLELGCCTFRFDRLTP
jgi:DNA-binding transcriptional ArsR family regulator